MVLASGGQDGAICLWDVLTGSKVSHMYAHRGDVTSLTCTTSCVISSGLDDVISIWDRSSGIKLYSIQQVGSWGVARERLRVLLCFFWPLPNAAAHCWACSLMGALFKLHMLWRKPPVFVNITCESSEKTDSVAWPDRTVPL